MEDVYEPVLEVSEYYDGPRKGVALLEGKPHAFTSRYLDATQHRGDFESVDIFELVPLGAPAGASPVLANAYFRVVSAQPLLPPGEIRTLEVTWDVFERAGP
jgi:hypothetical protein